MFFHLFVFSTFVSSTFALNYCPPLGAVYTPSKRLSSDPAIIAAAKNVTAVIDGIVNDRRSGSVPFNASENSFSISMFSSHESQSIFEYHHTATIMNFTALGVTKVDSDSIYRIGSVTKVFTVLELLLQKDLLSLDDPVTKYLPDFAANTNQETSDNISQVQWSNVTIRALASFLAGIGREFTRGDLAGSMNLPWTQLGFPELQASDITNCGLDGAQPACPKKRYLDGFNKRHPAFAPFTTPMYSNSAFAILGYVIEAITSKSYEDAMLENIFKPLNMSRTSISKPDNSEGVIPVGEIDSYWGKDQGGENAAGSVYTTTRDLSVFARAILNGNILEPSAMRQWLKPATHTSTLQYSVGAPWEILRVIGVTKDNRVIDLYTKAGGIGLYGSMLVLIPDYDVGFTLMTAGNGGINNQLTQIVLETLMPAIEQVGKNQAASQLAGHFSNSNNSSIKLIVDDGPGLHIIEWISRGKDILAEYQQITNHPNEVLDVRLYPTGLGSNNISNTNLSHSNGFESEQSFRAAFQFFTGTENHIAGNGMGYLFEQCLPWYGIDALMYGGIALDDFDFRFDSKGNALSLEPRALRDKLYRN